MLMETRDALLPTLREVADLPGIELEDRRWSAALHTQEASPKARQTLFARLGAVLNGWRVALYRHATMVEIQFLPEITMEFGARALCRFLGYRGEVICAGSDENDATALRWTLDQGGTALSLGRDPLVPGARPVVDVRSLARQVRDLAGIDENHRLRLTSRRLCNAA
jgi:trehalose 6-phosphate phosphatase